MLIKRLTLVFVVCYKNSAIRYYFTHITGIMQPFFGENAINQASKYNLEILPPDNMWLSGNLSWEIFT
jgi:hypothetical protein